MKSSVVKKYSYKLTRDGFLMLDKILSQKQNEEDGNTQNGGHETNDLLFTQ